MLSDAANLAAPPPPPPPADVSPTHAPRSSSQSTRWGPAAGTTWCGHLSKEQTMGFYIRYLDVHRIPRSRGTTR